MGLEHQGVEGTSGVALVWPVRGCSGLATVAVSGAMVELGAGELAAGRWKVVGVATGGGGGVGDEVGRARERWWG